MMSSRGETPPQLVAALGLLADLLTKIDPTLATRLAELQAEEKRIGEQRNALEAADAESQKRRQAAETAAQAILAAAQAEAEQIRAAATSDATRLRAELQQREDRVAGREQAFSKRAAELRAVLATD